MPVNDPLFEEIALAGPEHLDPTYVEGYDRKSRFDPNDDLAELRDLGLNADSTLIDLGAGTGTFAFASAAVCGRVIAVDVSPVMVAAMRSRASEWNITNVECIEAGFLSYEHTGEPADFVYTRNALHHLPDFWKATALHRMAELLQPGGVLRLRDLVFSFEPRYAEECLRAWLDTGSESPDDGWTRDELKAHLRDEHSTFNWLLEPMIERAGFEIEHAEFKGQVYAYYLCTKKDQPT
jgi:ubiquinone/menaquinone biosynthesis C-methylase UbiE